MSISHECRFNKSGSRSLNCKYLQDLLWPVHLTVDLHSWQQLGHVCQWDWWPGLWTSGIQSWVTWINQITFRKLSVLAVTLEFFQLIQTPSMLWLMLILAKLRGRLMLKVRWRLILDQTNVKADTEKILNEILRINLWQEFRVSCYEEYRSSCWLGDRSEGWD